jgi:hypothetical protein
MRRYLGSFSSALACAAGVFLSGCAMDVAGSAAALKPGAHFVGDPTCVQVGTELVCEGTVAGLGNDAAVVQLEVESVCINRGGNEPPGLASGETEPIDPDHGRIDFSVSADADCPSRRMTAAFTSPATVNIFQNDELVFTGDIHF